MKERKTGCAPGVLWAFLDVHPTLAHSAAHVCVARANANAFFTVNDCVWGVTFTYNKTTVSCALHLHDASKGKSYLFQKAATRGLKHKIELSHTRKFIFFITYIFSHHCADGKK